MDITPLSPQETEKFYPLFTEILNTGFPGYKKEVQNYLLNQIYHPKALKYWLIQNQKHIFVALDRQKGTNTEKMMGFVMVDAPYGGVSFCRWLGVHKKYQRKGVGTLLIHKWEEAARKEHAHKMEVVGQQEAKQFYEKMGFVQEGFRKKSYFGIDQYLFGKTLGEPTVEGMTG